MTDQMEQQPHPQNCKTCEYINEYSRFPCGSACPLHNYNLLNPHDIFFITEHIGCASHSSRPAPAPNKIGTSPICERCIKDQEPFCVGCYRLKPHDTAVAAQARKDLLDELYLLAEDMISDGERMIREEPEGKLYGRGKTTTANIFQMRIESLREAQP